MKINLNLKYLHKRQGYDKLYYQRIVPKDLVSFFKKKKLTISLPTTDLTEASELIQLLAAQHDKQFRQLRGQEPLTDSELLQDARDLKNLENWKIPVSDEEVQVSGRTVEDIQSERAYLAITDMADDGDSSAKLLLKNFNQIDEVYLEEAWNSYVKLKGDKFTDKELSNKQKTVELIIKLSGNKPVRMYKREDARKFRQHFLDKKQLPTGKRNQTRLQGVFTFAINEYDLDIRNPFSDLNWPIYKPSKKRIPFNHEELVKLSNLCKEANDSLRWCLAIQIETGARISEIVGLRTSDVYLDTSVPYILITETNSRRLKTKSSERSIPLVGIAYWAAKQLITANDSGQLFPQYDDGKNFKRDTATNALNKWLKGRGFNKTTHCLRHSMSDRLRQIECPLEIIEAILGHSNQSTSMLYGSGYSLELRANHLNKIALKHP